MSVELHAASGTHPGRVRSSNQDLALIAGNLVAVADGMGGHAGGEIAARAAVEALRDTFAAKPTSDGLVGAAGRANRAVFERGDRDRTLRGMGTTLTAAAIVDGGGESKLALVNVGDSRAYLFAEGGLTKLTEDHSLVEELVRSGELTPEQALTHPHRHILTRAIGVDHTVDVDSWILDVHAGMRLLLCSDGLTNECSDEELAEVLGSEPEPERAVEVLVERALAHGGSDNITVVVADVTDGGTEANRSDGAVSVVDGPSPARDQEAGEGGADGERAAQASTTGPATAISAAAMPTTTVPAAAIATTSERRARPARQRAPRRPAPRPSREPAGRLVTLRTILFCTALVAVLGGLAGFCVWFDQASYFVGLHGNSVVVYEGRPGGFLWFQPRLVDDPGVTTSDVFPGSLPELRQGMLVSSLDAARSTVSALQSEQSFLHTSNTIPPLPTTTTVPTKSSSSSGPTGAQKVPTTTVKGHR